MKKKLEEHPEQITTSNYWIRNGAWTLREALPHDHPENLYNWFNREYPDLMPEVYGIEKPTPDFGEF